MEKQLIHLSLWGEVKDCKKCLAALDQQSSKLDKLDSRFGQASIPLDTKIRVKPSPTRPATMWQ